MPISAIFNYPYIFLVPARKLLWILHSFQYNLDYISTLKTNMLKYSHAATLFFIIILKDTLNSIRCTLFTHPFPVPDIEVALSMSIKCFALGRF